MKLPSNQTACVRVQSIATPRGQHKTRAGSARDAAGHVHGHGVSEQGAISRGTTFNDAGAAIFEDLISILSSCWPVLGQLSSRKLLMVCC